MRRKYIVAVLLLLSLGVMSTLALSFTQTNLTENWDTIYTLQYGLSDLTLTTPTDTDLGTPNDGDLQVSIPASTASALTPVFTVEALDVNGDVISTDTAMTMEISVSLWNGATQIGTTQSDTVTVVSGTPEEISGTISYSGVSGLPSAAITKIVVKFDCSVGTGFGTGTDAFEVEYEQLRITVQDA
ncbi:MAG: hypothetical protein NWF07_08480 [Candidatus Bathyarchaeota archaeon]|nr:hypothetical protein [Candidatus Bathyarchaeota archaeon]